MQLHRRPRLLPAFLLSLVALGAAACVESPDEPDLGTTEDEIVGNTLAGSNGSIAWQGVVRLQIAGSTQVRTGVLVGPDLVVTSSRWVTATTAPSAITLWNGTSGGSNVVQRAARAVTVNPYLPFAFIHTAQAFPGTPLALDARTAAQLVGASFNCYAYRTAADFRRAAQFAVQTDGARELLVGPDVLSHWLEDRDAGAPCLDPATGAVVGFALEARPGNQTRLFGASHLAFFVRAMQHVADLRRASGGTPADVVHTRSPGGAPMCLDIASGNPYDHANVNQYPCHGGDNQRWYFEWRTGGAALVNVATGTCLDVPGFDTRAGTRLQAYTCNGGSNQTWAPKAHNLVDAYGPLSAPTLCLSVRGGASATSQPVEQATCDPAAPHQSWTRAASY